MTAASPASTARPRTTESVRVLFAALDRRGRNLAVTFGVAHLADRLALLAVALAAPREDRTSVIVAGAVLGVLTLVRAFFGSLAQAHAQGLLHVRVGESLLERDLLRASALEDDDPEAALLDGIDIGARIVGGMLPAVLADAVGAVVVAIVLVQIASPAMLLAMAVAVVGGALVLAFSRRLTVTESERAWAAQRPVIDRLVAIINARLEIVANHADGVMRSELATHAREWERNMGRFERASALTGRLPLLFGAALLAAVMFLRSRLPASELALAAVVLAAALPPFAGVARGLHDLAKLAVRVTPLASMLQPVRRPARASAEKPTTTPGTLSLDAVSFRYAGARDDVLRSATCDLALGTVTVLVGANGSGKSTLLRVLLGIEPPTEGRFLVDGQPLEGDALRAHIAYLPQRPYWSDRNTVREAFRLLAPDFDEARALHWIERVGMSAVLANKEPRDPLSTRMGRLSSGQRQRLALARVGMLDRAIWLFDEPDASLDAEGLARLETILDDERPKRIIVVAAHAASLLRAADRVLRIEGGRVSDEPRPSGTFP